MLQAIRLARSPKQSATASSIRRAAAPWHAGGDVRASPLAWTATAGPWRAHRGGPPRPGGQPLREAEIGYN
jgi:hypothetical protein